MENHFEAAERQQLHVNGMADSNGTRAELNKRRGAGTNYSAQHTKARTCSQRNVMASALTSRFVKTFCFFALRLQSSAHLPSASE